MVKPEGGQQCIFDCFWLNQWGVNENFERLRGTRGGLNLQPPDKSSTDYILWKVSFESIPFEMVAVSFIERDGSNATVPYREDGLAETDSSDEETTQEPEKKKSKSSNPSHRMHGAAIYSTSYKKQWEQTYKFVCQSNSKNHIFCTICRKDVSIEDQGMVDI